MYPGFAGGGLGAAGSNVLPVVGGASNRVTSLGLAGAAGNSKVDLAWLSFARLFLAPS
jgi:hypothetical protein